MGEGDMHFPSNCCEWQNVKNVGNVKEPPMVSMCSVEPRLTKDQTRDMWNSENWSPGELNHISDACLNLCSEGFGSPFTKID